MEMKTVGEIMIDLENYPAVQDMASLKEAMVTLHDFEIVTEDGVSRPRTLLVFDDLGLLVGMVRRRDILRGLEPQHLVSHPLEYRKKLFDVKVDPFLSELANSGEDMVVAVRQQAEAKVHEVMQPLKLWINHDDHVMTAIYEMVDNNISLLPVVKDDEVVGIVRSVDVFNEAVRVVLGD